MYPTTTSYSPELLELHSRIQTIAATPELGSEDYIRLLGECGTKYLSPNLSELAFPSDQEFSEKGVVTTTGPKMNIAATKKAK